MQADENSRMACYGLENLILGPMARQSLSSSPQSPKPCSGLLNLRGVVITAALPLSLFFTGRAEAISTITQNGANTSTSFSNLSASGASTRSPIQQSNVPVSFFKFDPTLGTLTGVKFTATGTTSGSIRGARNSQTGTPSSLSNGTAALTVNFDMGSWSLNSGAPTPIFGASSLLVGTSNATTGTLITAQTNSLPILGSSTDAAILALFTGAGDIDATFNWNVALNLLNTSATKTTNFNFAASGSGVTSFSALAKDLVLTYEYEPAAADVPGPLPLLGSATAFAFSRRLRRRISKVRTTV